MTTEQTRNVSLTAEMNSFIREQVACGRYQNASEVVRAGLRLLQDRERAVGQETNQGNNQTIDRELHPGPIATLSRNHAG